MNGGRCNTEIDRWSDTERVWVVEGHLLQRHQSDGQWLSMWIKQNNLSSPKNRDLDDYEIMLNRLQTIKTLSVQHMLCGHIH